MISSILMLPMTGFWIFSSRAMLGEKSLLLRNPERRLARVDAGKRNYDFLTGYASIGRSARDN